MSDYFATDAAAMISDLPAVASYGGATFSCSLSTLGEREVINLLGAVETVTCEATALLSDFATMPTEGSRIAIVKPGAATYSNFRIAKVDTASDVATLVLMLSADRRTLNATP